MCDASERLIAWLDRELPEDEAADLERHLQACGECRSRLSACQRASSAFNEYCDIAMASETRRRLPRWMPAAPVAITVAAAVVLFAVLPRERVEQPPAHSPAMHSLTSNSPRAAASPAMASQPSRTAMRSIETVRRRHAVAPVQTETRNAAPTPIQNANSLPAEPHIEIGIPAEAIYPPGAVPEGVNFVADLTVGADGLAQPLRLRPRLMRFERRGSQP